MNCTREFFEKTVHSKHPHKWTHAETSPLNGYLTVFALDTVQECKDTFGQKLVLADYIWQAGCVTFDRTGLFLALTPNPYTFPQSVPITVTLSTFPTWITGNLTLDSDGIVRVNEDKVLKCECGKEKHGFASHSSWCDIKG